MGTLGYKYEKKNQVSYSFVSKGRHGAIIKMVQFTPTSIKGVFNLAFGDLLPDGNIDDKSNSNNGDMIKVLGTVIEIVKDFTNENAHLNIVFSGSTAERTKLYHRILKNYCQSFEKDFILSAFVETGIKKYVEIAFNELDEKSNYVAFFIKKK